MSLFDTILAEGDSSENNQGETTGSAEPASGESVGPSWWWDKNTPGNGERPDWLPQQFKSAEDAARSYAELSKKVGTAPDKYDWSKGEAWIDPDYVPFQDLASYAKAKHVPQDVFDKMLDSVGKYLDEFNVDYEAEKQALGEGAEDRLRVLNNWAKSNFSKDAYEALVDNMKSASAVKAIEEIRAKMIDNNTTIPTGREASEHSISLSDIQAELNNNLQKYKDDPSYRKEIQDKMARASHKSGYVDKIY